MEIKNGYTLSEFVDLINKKSYQKYLEFHNDFNDFSLHNLGLIYRYNKFLKEPLKKEMFVNEVLHPDKCIFRKDYFDNNSFEMDHSAQLMCWQSAENKVIFKGWKKTVMEDTEDPDDDWKFYFLTNGEIAIECFDDYKTFSYDDAGLETIGDLFKATNGRLITQNVNI